MPRKQSSVTSDDSFQNVELSINSPRTAVLALTADEEDVISKACQSLNAFAEKSDKAREQLVDLNAVSHLVPLFSHESTILRQQSSLCLGTLMQAYKARVTLVAVEHWKETVLQLLSKDQSSICQENACFILLHLCKEYSSRKHLSDATTLEAIVLLLLSDQASTQKVALETLSHLCLDYRARDSLLKFDFSPPFLTILESEYNELQSMCLDIISLICKVAAIRSVLAKAGCLEKLVKYILTKEYHATHLSAVKAATALLSQPLDEVLWNEEIIKSLFEALDSVKNDVKPALYDCLAKSASISDDLRRTMILLGGLKQSVTSMLPLDPKQPVDPPLAASACRMLISLAATENTCRDCVDLEVIRPLSQLCSHADVELFCNACDCVANFCNKLNSFSLACQEAGIVTSLLNAFSDGQDVSRKAHAAQALASIFRNPEVRKKLESEETLVNPCIDILSESSSSTSIKAACCMLLAVLCLDARFRSQVIQLPGTALTIANLTQFNEPILLNPMLKLIKSCSLSNQLATSLHDAGTFHSLVRIKEHIPPGNPYLISAMRQLNKSSLSSRFALEGILKGTDCLVGALFYEVGPVRNSDELPQFSKLHAAQENILRPIFAVALGASSHEPWPVQEDDSLVELASQCQHHLSSLMSDEQLHEDMTSSPSLQSRLQLLRRKTFSESLIRQMLEFIAKTVSDRLGGNLPTSESRQQAFGISTSHADLKHSLSSNILPVGKLKKGAFIERALLFKALSDSCALEIWLKREQYNKMSVYWQYDSHTFEVDLTQNPGSLMKKNVLLQ